MLIGHEGHSLTITTGMWRKHWVYRSTGRPLLDAEGEEMTDGVLIINPTSSAMTVNYNLNGNHYVAQANMQQKLATLPNWPQLGH